jgi:hypothetical protein
MAEGINGSFELTEHPWDVGEWINESGMLLCPFEHSVGFSHLIFREIHSFDGGLECSDKVREQLAPVPSVSEFDGRLGLAGTLFTPPPYSCFTFHLLLPLLLPPNAIRPISFYSLGSGLQLLAIALSPTLAQMADHNRERERRVFAGAGQETSALMGSVVCQCAGHGQQQEPIALAQLIEHFEESLLLDPWTIKLGGFWFLRFTFAEVEELIELEIQRFRPLLNGFNGGNRVPAFNPGYVAP